MGIQSIIYDGCYSLEARSKTNDNFTFLDAARVTDEANIATHTTQIAALTASEAADAAAIAALQTALGAAVVYHAKYSFATDGGAQGLITPAVNITIPTKFVIQNVALNSTTAVTSLGSATVSVGLSAGGAGAGALVAATAKASWGANAFVQAIPVPQDCSKWIKMSAPGTVTITVAAADLTAGIIEVYLFGYQSGT